MAVTEARKQANKKWDAENMITLSCRIKKDQAEAFREKCREKGLAPNQVLKDFIISFAEE